MGSNAYSGVVPANAGAFLTNRNTLFVPGTK